MGAIAWRDNTIGMAHIPGAAPSCCVCSRSQYVDFTYRYTARPMDTTPGATDARALAVAFDYLTLRGSR